MPSAPIFDFGVRRSGGSGDLRQGNLTQILRYVRDHGPSSRHDIAHGCGLGISTMTDLIGELRARRLVKELDPVRRAGAGRPTRPIAFDGEPWCVMGMQLEIDRIRFAASTLGGRELWQEDVAIDLDHAGAEGLARVEQALSDQLGKIDESTHLLAVEIGLPDYVAADRRTVSWSEELDWRDIDLGSAVEAKLAAHEITGSHVALSNDSHLSALYAARCELDLPGSSIVAYLGGDRRLGSGLIIGGEIFRGAEGGAGDFAHLIIDRDSDHEGELDCPCGRSGCLESIVGLPQLLARSGLASADEARDRVSTDPARAVATLSDGANADQVSAVLRDAGAALGRAIDGIVGMVNPHAVVLGGYLGTLSPLLMPSIDEQTRKRFDIAVFSTSSVRAVDQSVPRAVNGAILAARDACFYDPLGLTRRLT